MTDWLDELLAELPVKPYPLDLAKRVQARLNASRQWDRWVRRGLRSGLLLMSALGLLLVIPWLRSLWITMPEISVDGLGAWLRTLEISPVEGLQEMYSQAINWQTKIRTSIETTVILALVLLMFPAIYFVIHLLDESGPRKEVAR